jgi:hypothetical protein
MPYIIMKRDDVPAGILQVLDLDPNTSQRNYTLDPPGQTKYVDPVENDAVVTYQPAGIGTPILAYREAYGLAAWFLTNVNDGSGTEATGSIIIALGNAAPGDTASVGTSVVGGPNVTFMFVAGAPATATQVTIGATEDLTAAALTAAINNPVNGLTPYLSAVAPGGGPPSPVDMTATTDGTAQNGFTIAVVGANLAVSGATFAGGVDSVALTAAEANTDALDVLTLLAFGDLTAAAGVLTLAAINGALTTGAITATQLTQVLDILAGRRYYLPRYVQIDADGATFDISPAVGAVGGPGFIPGTLRPIFHTGSLQLSFAMGELSEFTSNSFVYAGIPGTPNGEAVVVYNDDGTFYTP